MKNRSEIISILSIFILSTLILIVLQVLFELFSPRFNNDLDFAYIVVTGLNLIWYLLMAFGFYFAISTGLKLEFLTYKELSKSEKRMFIIRGLIYMYVVQIVVTLILDAFNLFELSNNQEAINALAAVGPLTQIFLVIFAVFLAPFTEEILFRRTLFNFIKKNSTPFLAVLLSSILFGLIHGLTELSNPVVLLPYVAVGIVLQYFYIQSKTLMVPMIMHALFNLIGVVVILVTTYFPAILS